MKQLSFPFLLLKSCGSYRAVTTVGGRLAVAFTTVEAASLFMEAKNESNWGFALVIRSGIVEVINDLERAELEGICLDPDPDEANGTRFGIADLRRYAVD